MKEIAFFGQPNAGKSTLVNALSGAHLRTGNQNGVTVERKSVRKKEWNLTDLPGVYSVRTISAEERVSLDYIRDRSDVRYIFVIEGEKLPSALELLPLLKGKSGMIVLTMCSSFFKRKGKIRLSSLSARLGVPVLTVNAYRKKEVEELRRRISAEEWGVFSADKIVLSDIYSPATELYGLADRLLFNPFFCLPFFLLLFVAAFYVTFADSSIGVYLKNLLQELFCVRLVGVLSPLFRSAAVRSLAVDGILLPLGSVLAFLPQIAILYLFLQLLEESGALSAFAFCADPFLRKLSVGGKSLFCLLIGFGCTTQGAEMSCGIPEKGDRERVLFALPYLSCSAKLPVYVTLLSSFFEDPFPVVLLLYLFGVGAAFLSLLAFGDRQGEEVSEFPRFHVPAFRPFVRTLCFRLREFVLKVGKIVAAFSLSVWFLSSFDFSFSYVEAEKSMLAFLCGWLKIFFLPLGVDDWQTAFALFGGIAAKENIAGLLSFFYPHGLPYSAKTSFALAVFVLLSPPCISAIGAEARRIGRKRALVRNGGRFLSALLLSYAVYFISEVLF